MNHRRRPHNTCNSTKKCSCTKSRCPNRRRCPNRHLCRPRWCPRCRRCFCRCCCIITPSPKLKGIHAQLEAASQIQLKHKEPVIFDKIIHSNDNDIRYNQQTGRFSLIAKETYLVNWNITVEGSYQSSSISFALLVDNQIQGTSTLPISVGQLNGTCLITVKKVPTTLSLVNYTNDTIQLSRFTPVANITIAKACHTFIKKRRRPC